MLDKQRELLVRPFKENEVEWRIQSSGASADGKVWALALCYVTNRAIMNRLDEVFGIGGWQNEFKPTPMMGGTLCGISVKFDGEWVTKWDGSEDTAVEATKGGLSSSMKRTAVQWGIGRYLYSLDVSFVQNFDKKTATSIKAFIAGNSKSNYCKQNITFHWELPQLPNFALPIEHSQLKVIRETALATGSHIEDVEAFYEVTSLANLTKEDGVTIIQQLSKKPKLDEEALELFKKELEKDK